MKRSLLFRRLAKHIFELIDDERFTPQIFESAALVTFEDPGAALHRIFDTTDIARRLHTSYRISSASWLSLSSSIL